MSASRPHPPAPIAGNDAPLIGERVTTCGRSEAESSDERAACEAGVISLCSSPREPDRTAWTMSRWRPPEPHRPRDWISARRPHKAACVAGHDAPLIDERAATRGRSATEGSDERGGVKSGLSVRTAKPNAQNPLIAALGRRRGAPRIAAFPIVRRQRCVLKGAAFNLPLRSPR